MHIPAILPITSVAQEKMLEQARSFVSQLGSTEFTPGAAPDPDGNYAVIMFRDPLHRGPTNGFHIYVRLEEAGAFEELREVLPEFLKRSGTAYEGVCAPITAYELQKIAVAPQLEDQPVESLSFPRLQRDPAEVRSDETRNVSGKIDRSEVLGHLTEQHFTRVRQLSFELINTLCEEGASKVPQAKWKPQLDEIVNTLDLPQGTVADLFHVHSGNLGRWLKGDQSPDVRNLIYFVSKHCGGIGPKY